MVNDMRYVVSVENLATKKKTFSFASSNLEDCRKFVFRKHRGCRLMTRSSDKESDCSLIEKYVHVFNKTNTIKTIMIIRIHLVALSNDYEEENEHETT